MQPVALQIQTGQTFDPMAAAQKGIQLGQMGIQTQKLQQDLIRQKLEEERLRQTIGTEAIAQQEAQRALAQRQREDASRKLISEAAQKFQKKDAQGRMVRDYEAEYQYLAGLGTLEPALLEDHRQKVLQNRSSAIRTESDANSVLGKQIIDDARVISGMKDNARAGQYLQLTTQDVARATGLPLETVQERYATVLNMGRPDADLISNSRGILAAQDISELSERQMTGAGIGREDFNPNSAPSRQAREFMTSRGISVPENVSLVDMRKDPRYAPSIALWEQERGTQIIPGQARLGLGIEAADITAQQDRFKDAARYQGSFERMIAGKPGAVASDLWQKFVLDPKHSEVGDRFREAMAARGVKDADMKDYDYKYVFRAINSYANELGKKASIREQAAGTTSPIATGGSATSVQPTQAGERVSPEMQKARDTDAAAIIQSEYQKEVANLQANPGDKRVASNVDALARELKREHKITVPGSSDVLRGANTAAKAPARTGFTRVRNKETGVVSTTPIPDEVLRRMLASGRFERVE